MYRYFDVIWGGALLHLPVRAVNNLPFQNIKSARGSDVFAYLLQQKYSKAPGFYVEFGALDGVVDSQTFLLEQMGWTGILSEPNPEMFKKLEQNRKAFSTELCVWSQSDEEIKFTIISKAGLSTISRFTNHDRFAEERSFDSKEISVRTISLNDLLDKFNAPKVITYLSIDTEGSEFEILSKFDFTKYKVLFLTCEHNNTKNRDEILTLMKRNGYKRIMLREDSGEDSYLKIDPF
jgi:FkbM family methyltransferase